MAKPAVGRELDERIFEVVFSFRKVEDKELPDELQGKECWVSSHAHALDAALHQGPPPAFSTSMIHTWGIVEALVQNGYFSSLSYGSIVADQWACHYYVAMERGKKLYCLTAPTAEEAVCRVALFLLAPSDLEV